MRCLQSTLNVLKSMSLDLRFLGHQQSDGGSLSGSEDSLRVKDGVGRVLVGKHEATGSGRVFWLVLLASTLRLRFRAFLWAPEWVVCALL